MVVPREREREQGVEGKEMLLKNETSESEEKKMRRGQCH
tara:strand:- start:101 stop:217 length:117 start_codon:yes stop_codon:yes gene_type:complete